MIGRLLILLASAIVLFGCGYQEPQIFEGEYGVSPNVNLRSTKELLKDHHPLFPRDSHIVSLLLEQGTVLKGADWVPGIRTVAWGDPKPLFGLDFDGTFVKIELHGDRHRTPGQGPPEAIQIQTNKGAVSVKRSGRANDRGFYSNWVDVQESPEWRSRQVPPAVMRVRDRVQVQVPLLERAFPEAPWEQHRMDEEGRVWAVEGYVLVPAEERK